MTDEAIKLTPIINELAKLAHDRDYDRMPFSEASEVHKSRYKSMVLNVMHDLANMGFEFVKKEE